MPPPTVRAINWPATVSAVQAILNGPPSPTQATIASGVLVRNGVTTAGTAYDAASNDGIANFGTYAASLQTWIAATQSAWVEADRVNRAIYKLLPPAPPVVQATFGLSTGVPPWAANTGYQSVYAGLKRGAVVPTVAPAFAFLNYINGTSGGTEPLWNTTIGAITADGTTQWQCVSAVASGNQPLPLPWDVTLSTIATMSSRLTAASLLAVNNPGLNALYQQTAGIILAQIGARPASNTSADGASLAANQALTTAIAFANAWIAASKVV